jgi:two-component system NtrC family sensor kinase
MLDIIHEKRILSSEDLNEFEEALATIIEQTDRCKEITQNLLNFARQEKLEIISTSLNDLIEKTLYLIEPDAKLGKVEIHRNLGRNLPLVETNPSQLQQVFLNILKNALDAVEPGGMIRVVSRSENGLIRILINDNGVGIPEVNLKKIFNPFFTTKPSGSGTGLGLSICYNILEKLGGTLEVESRVDSGTTFIVSIPEKSKDIEERGRLT